MSSVKHEVSNPKKTEQQTKNDVVESKNFYQLFTANIIGFLAITVIASSFSLWLLVNQYSYSQTLISEKLNPLQTQLTQQTYLVNSNKLIDKLFKTFHTTEAATLQEALSLQSKKLSLLETKNKALFQQWFVENNNATAVLSDIQNNYPRYKLLKDNLLIQIDTLLDAIDIELGKENTKPELLSLLTEIQNKLYRILSVFSELSLQTNLNDFDPFHEQINSLITDDYAKQIANHKPDAQHITDIIRDMIIFEDLILKHGLLVKWRTQLQLILDLNQQLTHQKQQAQSILDSYLTKDSNTLSVNSTVTIPYWVYVAFVLFVLATMILAYILIARIKLASKVNHDFISQVLQEKKSSLKKDKKRMKSSLYCSESADLIKRIRLAKTHGFNEKELTQLVDKNKLLEEELTESSTKIAALSDELALAGENTNSVIRITNERKVFEEAYSDASKQLVFISDSAIVTESEHSGKTTLDNKSQAALLKAYEQGRTLVNELHQASYYRYLLSGEAVLNHSELNLEAEIQACLFNLSSRLHKKDNKISVHFNENIQVKITQDAKLIQEMLTSLVNILLIDRTNTQLSVSLELIDKNNGQQTIRFVSNVEIDPKSLKQGKKTANVLPKLLERINVEEGEYNELTDYFKVLISSLHGENLVAEINGNNYQVSVTLPLAVINDETASKLATISFPLPVSKINKKITQQTASYLPMPIDVLLAVKAPLQQQSLQLLIDKLGLTSTVVSCESLLHEYWQTGRYATLITELNCDAFVKFEVGMGKECLPRGVFTLGDCESIGKHSEAFSQWHIGHIKDQTATEDIIDLLSPWLLEENSDKKNTTQVRNGSTSVEIDTANVFISEQTELNSFDFNRYIKHQGSPELALYMLDEYAAENLTLVENLSKSLESNDLDKVSLSVQSLYKNSKILAADNLIQQCEQWFKLLSADSVKANTEKTDKKQRKLLLNTKEAVIDINEQVKAIA